MHITAPRKQNFKVFIMLKAEITNHQRE